MRAWLASRVRALRVMWRAALDQGLEPHRFAYAIACGLFVSCSPVPPVLFMRTGAVIATAYVARANRLVAFLISHVVVLPAWVALVAFEVQLGARLLHRSAPPWRAEASPIENVRDLLAHALSSALLGGAIVAMTIALVGYAICRVIMRLRRPAPPAA